jgi:hypothetical protein
MYLVEGVILPAQEKNYTLAGEIFTIPPGCDHYLCSNIKRESIPGTGSATGN